MKLQSLTLIAATVMATCMASAQDSDYTVKVVGHSASCRNYSILISGVEQNTTLPPDVKPTGQFSEVGQYYNEVGQPSPLYLSHTYKLDQVTISDSNSKDSTFITPDGSSSVEVCTDKFTIVFRLLPGPKALRVFNYYHMRMTRDNQVVFDRILGSDNGDEAGIISSKDLP